MTTIKLLSAADLKSRFKKIVPFMSTEDSRYYLQGVYLEYSNGNLRATATNGHILCTMEWDLPEQEKQEPFQVICPALAVKNLVKNITAKKDEDGGVMITVSGEAKKKIIFDLFEFKYESQCIDGNNCFAILRGLFSKRPSRSARVQRPINSNLVSQLISPSSSFSKNPGLIFLARGIWLPKRLGGYYGKMMWQAVRKPPLNSHELKSCHNL